MVVPPSIPSLAVLPVGPLVVPGVPGVPGGPELLVILLVAVVVFGFPLVLAGGYLYWRGDASIEELERRIANLESGQAGGDPDSSGAGGKDEF